jgi:hypothetical protein
MVAFPDPLQTRSAGNKSDDRSAAGNDPDRESR